MMKVMEEIFTGTMRRFMGSGEPISNRDPRGNEGKAYIIRSHDTTVLKPPALMENREQGDPSPDSFTTIHWQITLKVSTAGIYCTLRAILHDT